MDNATWEVSVTKPTVNALLKAVSQVAVVNRRPAGKDWLTTQEVADQSEPPIGRSTAMRRLKRLLREGTAETCQVSGVHGGIITFWRMKT
jgi:hypothetical protein